MEKRKRTIVIAILLGALLALLGLLSLVRITQREGFLYGLSVWVLTYWRVIFSGIGGVLITVIVMDIFYRKERKMLKEANRLKDKQIEVLAEKLDDLNRKLGEANRLAGKREEREKMAFDRERTTDILVGSGKGKGDESRITN